MGIEDRDWYREERARKGGRKAPHEWGRKEVPSGQSLDAFLKAKRQKKTVVPRSIKEVTYNPKEFRGSKEAFIRNRKSGKSRKTETNMAWLILLWVSIMAVSGWLLSILPKLS